TSGSGRCGTAENNVAASETTASRAISLRPAIVSILAVAPRHPGLQRLLQLHTAGSLQQNHIAIPRLARQPFAGLLGRRPKLCPGSRLASPPRPSPAPARAPRAAHNFLSPRYAAPPAGASLRPPAPTPASRPPPQCADCRP